MHFTDHDTDSRAVALPRLHLYPHKVRAVLAVTRAINTTASNYLVSVLCFVSSFINRQTLWSFPKLEHFEINFPLAISTLTVFLVPVPSFQLPSWLTCVADYLPAFPPVCPPACLLPCLCLLPRPSACQGSAPHITSADQNLRAPHHHHIITITHHRTLACPDHYRRTAP